MGNIFLSIQHFFVTLVTVITTTVIGVLPFTRPTLPPAPVDNQEIVSDLTSEGNITSTPTITDTRRITNTPTPTRINTPTSTPTVLLSPTSSTRLRPVDEEIRTTTTLSPSVVTPSPTSSISPLVTSSPSQNPVYVVSDSSWKFSMDAPSGWSEAGFDDSSWISTQAPSAGQCPPSVIRSDGWIRDNGTLPMSVSNPSWAGQTGYFRKIFNLNFIPSSSSLRTLHDDDGDIYMNGRLIYSDHDGLVNRYAGDTGIRTATIDPAVFVQGQNVVGVVGVDSAGGCQSVQVEIIVNP